MSTRGLLIGALVCGVASSAWAGEAPTHAKAATAESRTLPGGAVVTFSSDAKYELGRPVRLQLSPTSNDKTTVQVIKLTSGRATVNVVEAKIPKTAVLFQTTRRVSAIAKGGQSVVIAGPDRITVAAVRGEMLAALGNDWKTVPSGVLRSFGGGATSDHPVPVAPKLTVPSPMMLALNGDIATEVRAVPTPDVEYRKLVLFRVDGDKRSILSQSDWHSDFQRLPRLPPGRYELQARSVDHFGVESAASDPISLRVIGAKLPEGARLVSDSILLGRSGRVKLIGVDGLEASYGHANVFIPVPKDVGLARGESTLLRLREPGATQELGIRLEPRTVKAEISFEPKGARWPGEPLRVVVKLFDHRGRPFGDELKTKPHVFINVSEVTPSWTHGGNTYSATVPAAADAGPWVVRVQVEDDFGDEVARDFIEVDSGPSSGE